MIFAAHSDPVRHYALQVLENVLKTQWNADAFGAEAKEAFKATVLELLANGTRGILDEPAYVKQKLVSVAAEAVKREWPQRWPSLLGDLFDIAGAGPAQAELVVLLLRDVCEDCVLSDFNASIPVARRNEILQALNSVLGEISSFFVSVLENSYKAYREAAGSPDAATNVALLNSAMRAVGAFVPWPPVEFLRDLSCVAMATSLLGDEAVRIAAVDLLLLVADRKLGSDARDIRLELIASLVGSCETLPEGDPAEDYAFHKRLARTVSLVGNKFLLTLRPDSADEADLMLRFMQVVLQLLQHPSPMITSFLLPLLAVLLEGNPEDHSCPMSRSRVFPQLAPDVCRVLRQVLIRDPARSTNMDRGSSLALEPAEDSPASQFIDEDFDDEDDYAEFHAVLRGKSTSLLQRLACCFPAVCTELLEYDVRETLARHGKAADALNAAGLASAGSTATAELGAVALAATAILNGVCDKDFDEDPAVWESCSKALAHLLAFESSDPLLLSKQALAMSRFCKLLGRDEDSLVNVLERLFAILSFRLPDDVAASLTTDAGAAPELGTSGRRLTADEMTARKRAGSALIHIAKVLPDQLLPHMATLIERAQTLIGENAVLESESVLLYEMLVLVSNAAHELEQQEGFVADVLSAPLEYWSSEEITTAFSSPQALLTHLRLTPETGAPNSEAEAAADSAQAWWLESIAIQRKVLHTMHTFWCVGRRSVFSGAAGGPSGAGAAGGGPVEPDERTLFPFAKHWSVVLPNVIALLGTLHKMWDASEDGSRGPIEALYYGRWLLAMCSEEVAGMLGGGFQAAALSKHGSYDILGSLAYWQHKARQTSHALLALCAAHTGGGSGFFCPPLLERAPDALYEAALSPSALRFAEHRQLTELLERLVLALCMHCPTDLLHAKLPALVSPLLSECVNRATLLWEGGSGDDGASGASDALTVLPGASDEDIEVMRDKIKRDLARSLVDTFAVILGVKQLNASLLAPHVHAAKVKGSGAVGRRVRAKGEPIPDPLELDPHLAALSRLLLVESAECSEPLIRFAISVVLWHDSQSVRRVLAMWDKFLPMLSSIPDYHPAITRELFPRLVQVRVSPADVKFARELQWQVVALIKEIYVHFVLGAPDVTGGSTPASLTGGAVSMEPRELLATLPGVTPQSMDALDGQLLSNRSEKERKRIMNDFLQDAFQLLKAAADGGEEDARQARRSILDLPEKLVVFGKGAPGSNWRDARDEASAVVGAAGLFDGADSDDDGL